MRRAEGVPVTASSHTTAPQRTGWTGYLEGKDRTALLELVAEPADDETLLAKV